MTRRRLVCLLLAHPVAFALGAGVGWVLHHLHMFVLDLIPDWNVTP